MNKNLFYILIFVIIMSCRNETKSDDVTKMEDNSEWIFLDNKDSIEVIGFSKRSLKGQEEPYLFVHYKSDRFNGDGMDEIFINETLYIGKALRELNETIPDTLILQAMGKEKKNGFVKEQSNFNTVIYFDGTDWQLNKK